MDYVGSVEEQKSNCLSIAKAPQCGAFVLNKYSCVLFSQCGFLRNGGLLVVAGERIVYDFLFRCRRNQADDRNQNQADDHSDSAAVNRGLKQSREAGAEQHVCNHQTAAEDEAYPARQTAGALPVQTVQERCEECARQSTPRDAHQLCNKGDIALVLDNGNNRRDGDEYKDKDANRHEQLALAHVLHKRAAEEINRQRRAGRDNQRGQRGHRRGQNQDDNQRNENRC